MLMLQDKLNADRLAQDGVQVAELKAELEQLKARVQGLDSELGCINDTPEGCSS